MAGDEVDELSFKLHIWAQDEMHFRPQGRHLNSPIPSEEAFKMYVTF